MLDLLDSLDWRDWDSSDISERSDDDLSVGEREERDGRRLVKIQYSDSII